MSNQAPARSHTSPRVLMARLFARTALLLVLATLTLGCSDVPAAQSPKPTDPWPAISAAIDRQDHATMLLLLRPLAAQGDARAQHNLGFLYLEGQGVAQDDQEAAHWFRLAAAQSDARAQYNLGLMYYRGQGVAQDDQEAARWFRLAAAQGNARAQSNLGLLYLEGKGVAQDYVRAHMWINIAASLGSGELATASAKIRDDFAEGMTPAQLEQAQTMARQCQSSDYKQCGEQAVK